MSALFANPALQVQTMEQRINDELIQDVADEVLSYADISADEKYNSIFESLIQRIHQIDAIYATENESKQQYFERMEQFLTLTNPTVLAKELSETLVFDEIETEYRQIHQFFSQTQYGKIFARYTFDSNALKALQAGILSDIQTINKSLHAYAAAVSNHVKVMKEIKDSSGGKTAFRIGSKIAGGLILGPLGSILGGALSKAVTNDDNVIVSSYSDVLDAWTDYINKLDLFLLDIKLRYRHILLTVIGGMFVRVSQDLKTLGVMIDGLMLGDYAIRYTLTEEHLNQYKSWVTEVVEGIDLKLKAGHYEAALHGATELYRHIEQNKLLNPELYNKEQSFMYIASLYKFAAHAFCVKESRTFLDDVHQLFLRQELLLRDEDLEKIGAPTQLDLAVRAVSQWVEREELEQKATVFPNLLLRLVKRYNSTGYYDGETPKSPFINWMILIGKLLAINYENKRYQTFISDYGIPVPQVKELSRIYRKTNAVKKDEITKFAKVLIGSARFWAGLRFLKAPYFLIPIIVAAILVPLYFTQDKWLPSSEDRGAQTPVEEPVLERMILTVDADYANVREIPSLEGALVQSVVLGNQFTVTSEQTDAEGRLWYEIELAPDVYGWISSKIVTIDQ